MTIEVSYWAGFRSKGRDLCAGNGVKELMKVRCKEVRVNPPPKANPEFPISDANIKKFREMMVEALRQERVEVKKKPPRGKAKKVSAAVAQQ